LRERLLQSLDTGPATGAPARRVRTGEGVPVDQFKLPRILVIGVAAAAMTACGGAAASSTRPAASSTAAAGTNVAGQLAQLTGSKLVLSGQTGATNVTVSSSTRITQTVVGTLANIVAGVCITAAGQKDAAGSVTAANVTLMAKQLMNGTCTPPAARNGASPRPGGFNPSGGAGPRNGASPPANFTFVRGEVASVSGTSVTINVTGGGTQTVVVPSSARISSVELTSTSKLAVGQCIRATGQKDSSGTIKARTLSIQPPGPNGCFTGGGGFGRGGGGAPTPAGSTA